MNIRKWAYTLFGLIVIAIAGCAAADDRTVAGPTAPPTSDRSAPVASAPAPPTADAQPLNGWYLQGASGSRLQPCGQSEQWPIGDKADLQARAKTFGLEDDTPVYVKLLARVSDAGSVKKVNVVQVLQFGSPTPVRDCSMTGVVTPAPGS